MGYHFVAGDGTIHDYPTLMRMWHGENGKIRAIKQLRMMHGDHTPGLKEVKEVFDHYQHQVDVSDQFLWSRAMTASIARWSELDLLPKRLYLPRARIIYENS
jgi:hypothetical protein